MGTFRLNYTAYPLVVGQADKYNFEGFLENGSSILLEDITFKRLKSADRRDVTYSMSNVKEIETED